MKVDVSIIMPAYNAENFIATSIESTLNQSFISWELIVINDGSTDSTEAIVKHFTDPRIVLISQINKGVASARNKGLMYAQGEYITFLDADDVLSSDSLKVRIDYLNKEKNVDLVDGQILLKDKEMKHTLHQYRPYYQGTLLPRLLALDSQVFFNVCYMFRRTVLGDIRFKESMTHAEDLLFYIELSSQSNVQYGFVSQEVYHYRSGHISTMTNLSGLEKGYIILLKEIRNNKQILKLDYSLLKLKIIKIMFLSWLKRGNVKSTLLSLKNILFLDGKNI